jgi:vitamin B12 transporter
LTVFAQSTDSIPIKQEISTVFVTAYSIDTLRYLDKETTFKLEANEKMTFNTLENILDNQSNISLKKYGEGQISTISVKGFNASQTNVVWNGVNINSPLLGQADMSTVSIGNNTSLKLQENNNDNIAGQVSLKNNFDYRKKLQLNVISSATSFGSFNQGVSFEFSKKRKVYSNSNASLSYNLNKYKYLNKSLANQEETYLKNAETMSFHFEQINGFKLKKNNEIRLFFKAFYADRNIAPTIYEFSSTKNQKDQLYLAKLEWQKSDFQKNYELIISHSFVNQIQSVKLSKTSTAIKYGSYSMQSNIWFYKKLLKNFYFDFNINNILENGFSNNYNEAIWRNKLYLKPSLKYLFFKNLALKFSIAEIIVNSKLSQPLPAIEIKYAQKHLPASIMLQFDYSRKAHFPSLNDLYWNPGGNINLKEEYAHNFNFNFIVQRNFKPFKNNHKFYFRNKIEIFNIYSENYIQWEPTEQGFWEPNNIGKVYSRGFTNDLTLKYTFDKNWYIQNIFSYNLTRITKLKETEQLIYAPINSITNGTNIQTKWFNILVNQQFVSEKYTNYNNTLSLDKYYLLDLILSKEFKLNNSHKLYIAFEANNLLNETYFTYINRALPKRNFAIKLKYTFQ